MFYSEEELGMEQGTARRENDLHKLYRNLPHPELLLKTTRIILGLEAGDISCSANSDGVITDNIASSDVTSKVNLINEVSADQTSLKSSDINQCKSSERKKDNTTHGDKRSSENVANSSTIDVNQIDEHGNSPLTYLILHINRGLRYHAHTVPQLQHLVDLDASLTEIEELCIKLDAAYQEQVYQCIELLLAGGADPNFTPERCPSIAHDMEWSKAYENKLFNKRVDGICWIEGLRWIIPSLIFSIPSLLAK